MSDEDQPAVNLVLGPDLESRIAHERDREALDLESQAIQLRKLTPLEYLERGIGVASTRDFVLVGMLAKVYWDSLSWDPSKGAWRIYVSRFGSYEHHVNAEEVAAALGCKAVP